MFQRKHQLSIVSRLFCRKQKYLHGSVQSELAVELQQRHTRHVKQNLSGSRGKHKHVNSLSQNNASSSRRRRRSPALCLHEEYSNLSRSSNLFPSSPPGPASPCLPPPPPAKPRLLLQPEHKPLSSIPGGSSKSWRG
ncbi:unnamed protein product [Pleuronectes platessa]|uniref:Uncharacterized protein n=1 Tax=Pleuronectes platessa TaxID=8262 RepID=A0A9N7TNR3_PLEPL|nr:unnamed protein product [Pleuronectes platessa]